MHTEVCGRCKERFRIRMAGGSHDRFGTTLFHHFSAVHDDDAICDARNDVDIVADKDDRKSSFFLQAHKQRNDLRLNRHVESCRRLVRNEQFAALCESERYADPLQLAARKLVRITCKSFSWIGKPYFFQERFGFFVRSILCTAFVNRAERFEKHASDGLQRIKGKRGLLKDHTDFFTAECSQLFFTERR